MDNEKVETIKQEVERISQDLFNYAIDREDVAWLVHSHSEHSRVDSSTLEYELQILKIVGTGWNVMYAMENSPYKESVSGLFWSAVHKFSANISEDAGNLAGKKIDYFQTLKDRLEMYIKALKDNSSEKDPAKPVGEAFAAQCGYLDDLYAFMAGAKMFSSISMMVQQYFEGFDTSI